MAKTVHWLGHTAYRPAVFVVVQIGTAHRRVSPAFMTTPPARAQRGAGWAAPDQRGRLLGTCTLPTTSIGFTALLRWTRQYGSLGQVRDGRHWWLRSRTGRLAACSEYHRIEVDRPDRRTRRRRGKSDSVDAEAAARAASRGPPQASPRAGPPQPSPRQAPSHAGCVRCEWLVNRRSELVDKPPMSCRPWC
jgi:hypothetical protein